MNKLQKNFREGHSRNVTSNQDDVHQDLVEVVRKHQCSHYRRPIASFSEAPFVQADDIVRAHGGPVILDSGCGTGESSFFLAASNPEHLVIAIDKSAVRIGRGDEPGSVDNLHIIRGNCIDFWRLAAQANWPIERHFLLYPTPWPKAHHLLRRWHGHPVFSALLELGGMLELRSNWAIYINEFALALATAGVCCDELGPFRPTKAITAFERKYLANNHELFCLIAQLGVAPDAENLGPH